jgi:RNA polymerase sigma factor (sigma-70 family)
MADAQMGPVVRYIRSLAGVANSKEQTDLDLLHAFRERNDQTAFATLVRRHGLMVLRVCRFTLGNAEDAEDALQATFLVLARKAKSLRMTGSLASWLHGVAYRMANNAKRSVARRRGHECRVTPPQPRDPSLIAAWQEVQVLLNEEIARLPEKLRVPFLLCCLENQSCAKAACQLGVKEATISVRLSRARKLLKDRLGRRGVSLTAVLAAIAIEADGVGAAVPVSVAAAFARAASLIAAGQGASVSVGGLVSTKVVALTEGVLKAMFVTKLKTAALMVLSVAIIGSGIGMLTYRGLAAGQVAAGPGALVSQTPKASKTPRNLDEQSGAQRSANDVAAAGRERQAGPNLLLIGGLVLIGPDGKVKKELREDHINYVPGYHRFSPDGKQVAFLLGRVGSTKPRVYVRGLEEKEPGTDMEVDAAEGCLSWSPDSKFLIVTDLVRVGEEGKDPEWVTWLVDIKTKKNTPVKLPANQHVTDWSSDGKYFLTTEYKMGTTSLHLVGRDGKEDRVLTKGGVPAGNYGRLSPDGGRVLYSGFGRDGITSRLIVLDTRSGKWVQVKNHPGKSMAMGWCWSPDGKRIAHAWRVNGVGMDEEVDSSLIVSDADGSNPVTIMKAKGSPAGMPIRSPDWR